MTSAEMQERLIQFAVDTSNLLEKLPQNYMAIHMSKQLFRSTTSIALNYAESNAAESRKDLIHKRRVCLKEAKESEVAIEILKRKKYLSPSQWKPIAQECGEIVAILISSTKGLTRGSTSNI